MADKFAINPGMEVIGSDGGMVGRVTALHGDHIHLEPTAPPPAGGDHYVPRAWVARVDQHVHLNREAALVRDTWGSGEPAGAKPRAAATAAAPADQRHRPLPDDYHGMGKSWIVWLLGAILLIAIIVLGVRGCFYAADDPNYEDNAKGELTEADRAASGAAAAGVTGIGRVRSDIQGYLASAQPAPRNFAFQDVQFEQGSAELRDEYRTALADLGRTLAAHPQARLKVIAYGDSSQSEPTLALRRAEAIAAALIANGVNSMAIATEAGQGTNRPAELQIVSR